jgi:hypothetical protein
MKIKKLAFLIVILIALYNPVEAQDYAFKVLVNKGKNEYKSGESWQVVKVGSGLKSADELKVGDNAYVGLVHASGKPVELKQAGKYKVVDLAAKVSGNSSVLSKYTDFILSANTTKKNNLAATGAVHRGQNDIQVYLPATERAVVLNNEVIINWATEDTSPPFTVTLSSMFGDELLKTETNDHEIRVDLGAKNFENEDNIVVIVAPKKEPNKASAEYTLKRISKADKERLNASLKEIMPQVSEPTALNKLVLAGFYEQNNLLIDAATAHQEAIKLAPDVPTFKDAYNDFLLRNGIKELPPKK